MSSGGGSSSGGVTRVEPPSYQLPYLQSGLQQAGALYNQGSTVVPFSSQTESALKDINQRSYGSPLTSSAQQYATNTLNGGFLNNNPYLDATFKQAAQGTQNQLASEFAGSGRDIIASAPVRSEQLNNLATQIYGGAYENERNRQQGVLGLSNNLANQDYVDLNARLGVGSQIEGLAQEYANAPGTALDQYLARVRGTDYGSSQVGPKQSRNAAAGALGGAATGATLGSYFGPWGTAIGAVGGGLLGGFG